MTELSNGILQEDLDKLMKNNKFSVSIEKIKEKYKLRTLTVKSMGEIVNFKENK